MKNYYLGFSAIIFFQATTYTTGFPWWYNAILSKHMPNWLIKILEHPNLIAFSMGTLLILIALLLGYLTVKLLRERRKNRQLEEKLDLLNKAHQALLEENSHHRSIVKQLSTILTAIARLEPIATIEKNINSSEPNN